MFFVISGYLITLTLITEKQLTGTISLIGFYKRRIFRIAPATIFIILITILLANLFMNFEDLSRAYKGAIFSVFGFTNVYFIKI
jgi:peptidoglycan/LPS O-acetylase OafA/YrhL